MRLIGDRSCPAVLCRSQGVQKWRSLPKEAARHASMRPLDSDRPTYVAPWQPSIQSSSTPTARKLSSFHFVASSSEENMRFSFPSLLFEIYPFVQESDVALLISPSLRKALDKPSNHARNHIPSLLPTCVSRALYLDSDVILVDDVRGNSGTRRRRS